MQSTTHSKGRVERPIPYLRENFFCGCTFVNDAYLNEQAGRWLDGTANVRRHGTTGERHRGRFERDERHAPGPLAGPRYRRLGATQTPAPHRGRDPLAERLRGGGAIKATAENRRDRVRATLADLKMPGALEAVDDILGSADSGAATADEVIEQLLNALVELRNNRRLKRGVRRGTARAAGRPSTACSPTPNWNSMACRSRRWSGMSR